MWTTKGWSRILRGMWVRTRPTRTTSRVPSSSTSTTGAKTMCSSCSSMRTHKITQSLKQSSLKWWVNKCRWSLRFVIRDSYWLSGSKLTSVVKTSFKWMKSCSTSNRMPKTWRIWRLTCLRASLIDRMSQLDSLLIHSSTWASLTIIRRSRGFFWVSTSRRSTLSSWRPSTRISTPAQLMPRSSIKTLRNTRLPLSLLTRTSVLHL